MKNQNLFVVLILLTFNCILVVQSYRKQVPINRFNVTGKNQSKSSNLTAGTAAKLDFFRELDSFPIPKFKILNFHDGLSLTIEGVNNSYARVVGESWNNFKEQKWEIKKAPSIGSQLTYGIFPLRYTYNSALTYYKDPAQKYPTVVSWEIKKINTSTINKHPEIGYQFLNERTKQCLRSEGRRRAVVELKCDIYDKKQLWKIVKL